MDQASRYSKNGLTISFKNLSLINSSHEEQVGELEEFQIDHPIRLEKEMVRNHLLSLWYRGPRTEGKPLPVFTSEEADELSTLFRAAFNKMDNSQYIEFEYQGRHGIIAGEVFGSVGKVHWRMERIHDLYYVNNLLSDEETWEMVRRLRGQIIYKEKTAIVKVDHKNWIINDLQLPSLKRNAEMEKVPSRASRIPQRKKTVAPQSSNGSEVNPDLRRKLQLLKQLRDEGLIEEGEYRKKKEEMLKKALSK